MQLERPTTIDSLVIPELLNLVRKSFESSVQDTVKRAVRFPLTDCLMSGVAMFGLKYPSLLQFDQDSRGDPILTHNLKTLFGVNEAPSDTYFRERLDPILPHQLQPALDNIINWVNNNNALSQFKYLDDYYLISLDATGSFSSNKIHCEHCCEKHHADGSTTYFHQTLAAVMVHPDCKVVLPMVIEPITKADGDVKNDCEHNAAKRLLVNLRNKYPDMKMIISMDALYADGPIITLLKKLNFSFIITAKDKDLKYLFKKYGETDKHKFATKSSDGRLLVHNYAEDLPLNSTHNDIKVNLIECTETSKQKTTRYCWITDLPLTEELVAPVAAGGRARWKIENETFNTLKNQDYNFEHNFGHGVENLSSVLTYLMFIAFLIDQVLQLCCAAFKMLLVKCISRIRLWRKMAAHFTVRYLDDWKELYLRILGCFNSEGSLTSNTS